MSTPAKAATTGRIPATIVTGFLGSGKTTLLKNMLNNADGLRVAVIVNEFGELGIDGEILRGCGLGCDEDEAGASSGSSAGTSGEQRGTLYELANGCLCCTVQEEFFPVMRELVERREEIDHILIETSGLALPKPLVQAFNWPEIRNACTVDAVITVVDTPAVADGRFAADPEAVQAQREADPNLDHDPTLHELFEDQLGSADLVILSKTDLTDAQTCVRVEAVVREEIPAPVKIVRSDADGVDLSQLLGLASAAEEHIHLRHSHHDHHHGDGEADHDHDHFDSLVIQLPVVNRDRLLGVLQALVEQHTIFRVKGFVALAGKPMRLVVHGVGRRFDHYFDRRWKPEETPFTHLVFIGRALDQATLEAALRDAVVGDAERGDTVATAAPQGDAGARQRQQQAGV
ncbi:MAG: cobalamin biosynthesis protein CobW [Pseudomonadota bacterium]